MIHCISALWTAQTVPLVFFSSCESTVSFESSLTCQIWIVQIHTYVHTYKKQLTLSRPIRHISMFSWNVSLSFFFCKPLVTLNILIMNKEHDENHTKLFMKLNNLLEGFLLLCKTSKYIHLTSARPSDFSDAGMSGARWNEMSFELMLLVYPFTWIKSWKLRISVSGHYVLWS